MTSVALSRPVISGVTTLGHGRRVVVWTQGCTLACVGCMSRDSWPGDGADSSVESVDVLAGMVVHLRSVGQLDGLTISGGEPFQQADAVAAFVEQVRAATPRDAFDILVYSGYTLEHLRAHGDVARHRILESIDVLVDGRFRDDESTELAYRGSANQQLHCFTDLARVRYADAETRERPRPSVHVVSTGSELTWVGIPARGELEQHRSALRARGVELDGTSW